MLNLFSKILLNYLRWKIRALRQLFKNILLLLVARGPLAKRKDLVFFNYSHVFKNHFRYVIFFFVILGLKSI
jgi:hypothetical protein